MTVGRGGEGGGGGTTIVEHAVEDVKGEGTPPPTAGRQAHLLEWGVLCVMGGVGVVVMGV